MRVRVSYTVEVDDRYRRALRLRYGRDGLATRAEIMEHYRLYGGTVDDDMLSEMEASDEAAERWAELGQGR